MNRITGTLINYYFHCKTQCWLSANRLNLEDNSEDVHIGRVLHEINEEKSKHAEVLLGNVKIDKITDDYVIEFKKSDSDPEAAKWQLLLELFTLKQKGIEKKGKLEYAEKNRQTKTEVVILDDIYEAKLLKIFEEIDTLIEEKVPPKPIFASKCKRCAYYEYCFI
ncbi:MAG: CRISPR-associated protein Cas4 [Campylobacteraceae bacterium]|jgi:CRISPR-associated exonuclease Cas4|nr:CRISPR-associated protein Cas4 [Campylobacteraceae bacterium]